MTNLDRLKGTGLLLHGFESFLEIWLGENSAEPKPINWVQEDLDVYNQLAPMVREYYELIHRWPQLGFIDNSPQYDHELPPRHYQWWNRKRLRPVILESYITLIATGRSRVVYAKEGPQKGCFLQNYDMNHSRPSAHIQTLSGHDADLYRLDPHNWDQIEQPFDEFILTNILPVIIEGGPDETVIEWASTYDLSIKGQVPFFSGESLDGSVLEFFYFEEAKVLGFDPISDDNLRIACRPVR